MSINLLPWREIKRHQHIRYIVFCYGISACFIFLTSVFIEWVFEHKIEVIRGNIDRLQSKISSIPPDHLKQNNMLLMKLKKIEGDKLQTSHENEGIENTLREIANDLPASMLFQSLHMHDNKMTINGIGNNINDIHTYVTLLQQKIMRSTITLSDVHGDAKMPSQFNFTIRATI